MQGKEAYGTGGAPRSSSCWSVLTLFADGWQHQMLMLPTMVFVVGSRGRTGVATISVMPLKKSYQVPGNKTEPILILIEQHFTDSSIILRGEPCIQDQCYS